MKFFKITFVNNEPISCKEITTGVMQDGTYHFLHAKGKMIYAIVAAESEGEALRISNEKMIEFTKVRKRARLQMHRPAFSNCQQ